MTPGGISAESRGAGEGAAWGAVTPVEGGAGREPGAPTPFATWATWRAPVQLPLPGVDAANDNAPRRLSRRTTTTDPSRPRVCALRRVLRGVGIVAWLAGAP